MGVKSILQGDALKVSILLFLVSTFLMMIVKDVRKLFNKSKKKAIIYGIILLIVFALVGLLSSPKVLNDTALNSFIGFQVLFLILGCVHVWVVRTFFKDLAEDKSNFINEFFFSLAFALIGLISFYKVVDIFKPDFNYTFLTAIIPFMVPMLTVKLFEAALLIPVKVYKQWLYPLGENVKDPTSNELKNPIVISFEFKKKGKADNEVTNFRVKAPENLEFGKLFYFFLNDYNERNTEEKVEFLDDSNQPYKWVFYRKPSFFKGVQYLNFSKTVNANNLKEDDVVICQRS